MRKVVRMKGWYGTLEFHSGSIVTTTGFTVYSILSNRTKDELKDSIYNTLLHSNASLLVDRNTIRIYELSGRSSIIIITTIITVCL